MLPFLTKIGRTVGSIIGSAATAENMTALGVGLGIANNLMKDNSSKGGDPDNDSELRERVEILEDELRRIKRRV